MTCLRRYLELYAWGIYAIGLVGWFLSAQRAAVSTGACGGACNALLVVPLISSFFQDILLLSHLHDFNTVAMCSLLGPPGQIMIC